MNTYVLIELVNGYLIETEVVQAESFREALIALEFRPYDLWEDIIGSMYDKGLITDDRLKELHTLPNEEVAQKQAIGDYAVEYWWPIVTSGGGHYILEIRPDGSVSTRPGMTSRLEAM